MTFSFTAHAQPAQCAETVDLRQLHITCFIEDRSCQRMAGTLLQRRRQTQRLRFVNISKCFHCDNLRLPFGQRPGFIEHYGIERTGALQRVGVPHQHTKLSRPPDARNNRHRRRQSQRTRTGDNQHRGGNHQGIDNLRCRTKEIPDCRTDQRNDYHYRHKHGGDFIRQLTDFWLAALGLSHHANDS